MEEETVSTNDDLNPAMTMDLIINEFGRLLGSTGVPSTGRLIKSVESGNYDSFISGINEILLSISVTKASLHYTKLIELAAEIAANLYDETYFINLEIPDIPELGHDNDSNIKELIKYISIVKVTIQPLIDDEIGSNKKNEFLSAIENKKKILNKGFFYEFTDGDLSRVQELINELRQEIITSDLFDESHRSRLLRRLEATQSELHKKMSDVDRIWGLVGDAGIVIGKFGKDAKPFVDRIKELSQIAWKTQARAEELPSSSQNPLLGNENQ